MGSELDRRGMVTGMIAAMVAPPARAPKASVNECAEALARALAAKHGGAWHIHVDAAGLMVMLIKKPAMRT